MEAFIQVAEEIKPSHTEADIVDTETFVLRGFFKSEAGETRLSTSPSKRRSRYNVQGMKDQMKIHGRTRWKGLTFMLI